MNDLEKMAKEARRKYDREYYAKNKEKRKAAQHRYWTRRALRLEAERAAQQQKEQEVHPDGE